MRRIHKYSRTRRCQLPCHLVVISVNARFESSAVTLFLSLIFPFRLLMQLDFNIFLMQFLILSQLSTTLALLFHCPALIESHFRNIFLVTLMQVLCVQRRCVSPKNRFIYLYLSLPPFLTLISKMLLIFSSLSYKIVQYSYSNTLTSAIERAPYIEKKSGNIIIIKPRR